MFGASQPLSIFFQIYLFKLTVILIQTDFAVPIGGRTIRIPFPIIYCVGHKQHSHSF